MPIRHSAEPFISLDLSKAEGNILVNSEIIGNFSFDPTMLALLPSLDAYLNLRQSLSQLYGVSVDEVILGNGSDEFIEDVARIRNGKVSITLVPTFERLYEVNKKFGYVAHEFAFSPDDNFHYTDVLHKAFMDKIEKLEPNIIWLCSPVNPTGSIIDPEQVRELAAKFPDSWLIVDAAFADIVDANLTKKYSALIRKYDNLLILNSFSKSWGIAAVRIGFLLTNKAIAQRIMQQHVKFNVNALAVDMARLCLEHDEYRTVEYDIVHKHLALLRSAVTELPEYVFISNSDINMFCLNNHNRTDLHERLLGAGIKTKNLNKMPGMQDMGFCRILVPRERADVDMLLKALADIT
jgi:histidinol-phosphate aminotransferase